MDRTFAEVRAAFEVWALALGAPGRAVPPAVYDATRDAARQAATLVLRELDARGRGGADAARHARITALILYVAAAAWLQGAAAARDEGADG